MLAFIGSFMTGFKLFDSLKNIQNIFNAFLAGTGIFYNLGL